jgi:hypothetical protein
MKLGTENKTKTILAIVLAVVAVAVVAYQFMGSSENSAPPPNTASSVRTEPATSSPAPGTRRTTTATRGKPGPLLAQTLDPTLRFDLLKSSEDMTYKGSGRDIFRSEAPPPPPMPKPVVDPTKVVHTPPPPPPINLKLYGYAQRKNGEAKKIFLSSGDDIFVAKEGDIVNRRYKILKINNNSVDVEDVLTNNRQTLYLTQG